MTQIRQGDVFLHPVTSASSNLTEIKPTTRGVVIQEGEVTGHAHRITGPLARHAKLYRTEMDARFLRVTAPVELTHEEHKTRCAICTGYTMATHRVAADYSASGYRCERHAESGDKALLEPGSTVVPKGTYSIGIHAEYEPGALPRQVED